MNDAARFHPGDPVELVAASFACPVCLHAPSVVRLPAERDETAARCGCQPCSADWEVALNDLQMLRLALAPPPSIGSPPTWGVGFA